jgi:putative transcriptional regulator
MTGPDPAATPGPDARRAPRAGRLLVATPLLLDPNFARTVVLLLDHDETGTLGAVLNRPSTVSVSSVLPAWDAVASPPQVLFQGGPVGTDSALAVGELVPGADEPVGFREVFGGIGIVDLDTPVELLSPVLRGLRVFAGYAGWGVGQLAAEIEEGSWYVVDSLPSDVFHTRSGDLWRDVLRRQPGELAWVATMPADPALN